MLIEFARILERNLIADGIAVRFGGEEFMLILPDVTEEEIRHMLAKMSADYRLFGKQKKNRAFTFSCGVEQFADGMDVSTFTGRRMKNFISQRKEAETV